MIWNTWKTMLPSFPTNTYAQAGRSTCHTDWHAGWVGWEYYTVLLLF